VKVQNGGVASRRAAFLPVILVAAAILPPGLRAGEPAPASRETLPITAEAYTRRGLEFLARPRPEDQREAERLLRKALRLEPESPLAHKGLARVSTYLYTLGLEETGVRLDTALEEAARAVAIAPEDAPARATLALALAADNRLTPALMEARHAVSLDPACAEAHLALGIILRLRMEVDEALASCRRAARLEPDSPRVLVALADALREKGLQDLAIEMYGQAIDLDPRSIVPQLGAAAAFQKAGREAPAAAIYNTLLKEWDYALDRVRLGAGALLVAQQEYESALEMYGGIDIPSNGSLPTLLALYGKGYSLLRLGRPAEAEYFLSGLIERAPRDYDGPVRGREMVFRAYEDLVGYFADRGNNGKMVSLLRSACERPLAPTRMAARLAARLEAGGRADEGVAILGRAILGADPLEDPVDLAESVLVLARLGTSGGSKGLPRDSPADRALRVAAERIAPCEIGVAHYRMARAWALLQENAPALASLERAGRHGYLPKELLLKEGDFDALRDDAAFKALARP
jgi:tetratricopeptide (TPR) repeat protein